MHQKEVNSSPKNGAEESIVEDIGHHKSKVR